MTFPKQNHPTWTKGEAQLPEIFEVYQSSGYIMPRPASETVMGGSIMLTAYARGHLPVDDTATAVEQQCLLDAHRMLTALPYPEPVLGRSARPRLHVRPVPSTACRLPLTLICAPFP